MTATVSMEIAYIKPDGSLTYEGMNLWQEALDSIDAAASSLDGLSDVAITTPATGQALVYDGTNWINRSGITLQTAQTASGQTEFDFTGVPAWVNRITVTGFSLSSSGTSNYILRVGDGAVVATGYLGAVTTIASATATTNNPVTGAPLVLGPTAASVFRFKATIDRVSGNTWVISGSGSLSNTNTTSAVVSEITLTGALDRVRLTTVNGTDTFDAGTVNIAWE